MFIVLLFGYGFAIPIADPKLAHEFDETGALNVLSDGHVKRGELGGYHGIKGFGGSRGIGKREVKGGGLGGYQGIIDIGGVHAIGNLNSPLMTIEIEGN